MTDLDVFLLAGEESGDRLGAALMRALRQRTGGGVRFAGAGGREMTAEGIDSLYSLDALSIMGITAIPARLPAIWRLMRRAVDAVVRGRPRVLVLIDNQEFNRAVARRVRRADPSIAIVQYVSPSVWAWWPGRARAMRGAVDHILALLPFEPAALARLGGPPCTYVGHPLTAEAGRLRPDAGEAKRRLADPPVLLVLPGSRRGEVERHAQVFGETVGRVAEQIGADRGRGADGCAPARADRRGHGALAGAAADRHRAGGEAGGVPDRAGGAGQVRHGHARTGGCGRADGHGLSFALDRGGAGAAADQARRRFGHPRQPGAGGEGGAGISAGGLHGRKAHRGAGAAARPIRRSGGGRWRRSESSMRSWRSAAPRRRSARRRWC